MEMEMYERIAQIRKDQKPKMTQAEFAESIGMPRETYKNYEYGKSVPSGALIRLICMKYNVNQAWLETGEGEPYIDAPDEQMSMAIGAIMQGKPASQIALMATLAAMPDDWWALFSRQLAAETEKLNEK